MTDQVHITIDREIYDRLQMLMVPPVSNANAVIKELLSKDGRTSDAAIAVAASERHFTFEQELERARSGIYECGGCG